MAMAADKADDAHVFGQVVGHYPSVRFSGVTGTVQLEPSGDRSLEGMYFVPLPALAPGASAPAPLRC